MSKTRDTGFLGNVIKVDTSGNVSFVSGSTTLATLNTSGQLSGSSPVLSSSYALNADLLDGLDSTQFTLTSSFAAQTASFTAFTASVNSFTASQNILNGTYATTGSNTFTGIQTINSNLVVTGSITAQTLVVQTITSSVSTITGSTNFGSLAINTHTFTGSVNISGSSTTALNINSGSLFVSSSGNIGMGTITPTVNLLQKYLSITDNYNVGIILNDTRAGSAFEVYNAGADFYINYGTSNKFKIVGSTGAATFSGTIQSGNISIPSSTGESSVYMSNASADLAVAAYSSSYGAVANYAGKSVIQAGNAGSGTGQLLLASWESSGIMTFYTGGRTSGFERMRITNGGAVLINVTTTYAYQGGALLHIRSDQNTGTNIAIQNQANNSSAAAHVIFGTYGNGWSIGMGSSSSSSGNSFYFSPDPSSTLNKVATLTTGGVWSTSGGGTSDRRKKQNIEYLNSNALNTIISLKPAKFEFINDPERTRHGFIAQDILEVKPDLVLGDGEKEDGTYGLDYDGVLAIAVKAIQEQQAQINELKAQING